MPEIASLPDLSLDYFSDEVLTEIIRAGSLCGDDPIVQTAMFVRNFRKFRVPLESDISGLWKESYLEALCNVLYVELLKKGAIDGLGRLDLERLRSWVQELHQQAIDRIACASQP